MYEDATCEVFLVKNMQISNKNSFPGLKNWHVVIWFLDGVRYCRQIYLEEINSDGAGVDCWIVFKTATKLTSENCTTSALILALTCTSTFCRHVNVDVDVVVHVVDIHVLGRRQSWCSLAHCRLALAPASISTV